MLNPFTKQILNYSVTPGQVVNVPQGWWHYEEALEDDTHLLAIFDAPTPQVILGSDILKLTPPKVMAENYCMDEQEWIKTSAPVQPSTYIGPNCPAPKQNNYYQMRAQPDYQPNFVYQYSPYYW